MNEKQTLQTLRVLLLAAKIAAVLLLVTLNYGLALDIAANPIVSPNGGSWSCGIEPFAVSRTVQHDVESIMTLNAAIICFLFTSARARTIMALRRISLLAVTPILVHTLCAFFFNSCGAIGCSL